ncbi:hypothetical protein ACFE04_021235 [Oxalis oulophora]
MSRHHILPPPNKNKIFVALNHQILLLNQNRKCRRRTLLDNNNMLSCGACKRMRSSSSSEDTRISHFHHLVAWLGVDEWNFSKLDSDVSSLDSSATEYEQGFCDFGSSNSSSKSESEVPSS